MSFILNINCRKKFKKKHKILQIKKLVNSFDVHVQNMKCIIITDILILHYKYFIFTINLFFHLIKQYHKFFLKNYKLKIA